MLQRKYQVSIKTPCSQKWEEMHPNEVGKFCDHCSKSVIDFTGSSSKEILNHLNQTKGDVCGRLNKSQTKNWCAQKTKSSNLLKSLASGLLILGSSSIVIGQEKVEPINPTESQEYNDSNANSGITQVNDQSIVNENRLIKGKVLEAETREPLLGVNITLNNNQGTTTDQDGYFELLIPDEISIESGLVEISLIGFENQTFPIKDLLKDEMDMVILFQSELIYLGMMEIETKKWWQFWK